MRRIARRASGVSLFIAFVACAVATMAPAAQWQSVLCALVVGGGPTPESNQVAIESNVRYVLRLLPGSAPRTVLFADGNPNSKNVFFETPVRDPPAEQHLLDVALSGKAGAYEAEEHFRKPSIPQQDGGLNKADIARAFGRIRSQSAAASPVLLYFTGHGSPNQARNLDNNAFDLWGDQLSVHDLASLIATLPKQSPVTLVMVQCFSGAFGNVLFENGDPNGNLTDRDVAGFFATVRERMAAGCTPEVDEAEYHDFTSYFFSALTGEDRVGRHVSGADYNQDGTVGMDEAYDFALIHDRSIDVPVATRDVFLRRFVKTPDDQVFKTPYSTALSWADTGQRAALEGLSSALKVTGEDRASKVMADAASDDADDALVKRLTDARGKFRAAAADCRQRLVARWAALKDDDSEGYEAARTQALAAIRKDPTAFNLNELAALEKAYMGAQQTAYERELTEAKQLRFVRLYKTIVLAHDLKQSGDPAIQKRYTHLVELESRPLFPTRDIARRG